MGDALEKAKTSEEALELMKSYAEKVKTYNALNATSSNATAEINKGDESKFLANELSNIELKDFQQQPHRLQLNGCTISYNEKSDSITTITSLLNILGDNYEITEIKTYNSVGFYYF